MKNYVQDGDKITVTAPAAVASGAGVLVGALFGVALAGAASGADVVIQRTGVVTLNKTSAQAWAVGDLIYWDSAAGEATNATSSTTTLIGAATSVAANPSSEGNVLLDGAIR